MPKRTKNHRTGKAAVTEFMRLASDAWEVREKSGDYGVDLEIEVFNSDDSTTGTVAYVQSKGTTSKENEPSVSIRVETLQYLNSFDVPSFIFCHSTLTGNSFWMWAQEAIWRVKPGATTVSLRFREHHLWHDATSDEIDRSLKSHRLLRARDNYTPFPIIADEENSELDPIVLNGITAEIAALLPFTNRNRFGHGIPLKISIRGASVQIRIEKFLWRSIRAKSENHFDLRSAATYLLVKFWSEFGFSNHAEIATFKCLENILIAPDRDTAAEGAIVLVNRPQAAVEFALMNNLHVTSDVAMNSFFLALYNSLGSVDEKTESLEIFVNAALTKSKDEKPSSALQYNIAKFYRNSHQFLKSISAYNDLRKFDPSYLERTYYWYEIGNVLYLAKKYIMAAICYKNLVSLEKVPITHLVLGDAYLYGRELAEAKSTYSDAKDDLTSIGAEAALKYEMIQWIESLSESDKPSPADRAQLLNFREIALEKDDPKAAFWSHMALTFLDIGDIDCWADAIILSLRLGDISLFQDILRCATSTHRLKPYIKFKADQAEFFDQLGELGEELDRIARNILDETLAEEKYEPGVSIGEPEELFKQGVLRVASRF